MTTEDRYSPGEGATNKAVKDDNTDVHCFKASLSLHDLDAVGGASARAGLRRTTPR